MSSPNKENYKVRIAIKVLRKYTGKILQQQCNGTYIHLGKSVIMNTIVILAEIFAMNEKICYNF